MHCEGDFDKSKYTDWRELAPALGVSRATVFNRAEREKWPFESKTVQGGEKHLYLVDKLPGEVQRKLHIERYGTKCMNKKCEWRDESSSDLCGRGGPPIDMCWERLVRDDPTVLTMLLVREEVRCARKQFPHNKHLLGALMEEVGELAKAFLQGEPRHRITSEAIQVAAVAIRIIEERDGDYDGWTAEDGKPKGVNH